MMEGQDDRGGGKGKAVEQQWHEEEEILEKGKAVDQQWHEQAGESLFEKKIKQKKFEEVPRWPFKVKAETAKDRGYQLQSSYQEQSGR
eukprot:9410847-Karenia_brevis.AAC.1